MVKSVSWNWHMDYQSFILVKFLKRLFKLLSFNVCSCLKYFLPHHWMCRNQFLTLIGIWKPPRWGFEPTSNWVWACISATFDPSLKIRFRSESASSSGILNFFSCPVKPAPRLWTRKPSLMRKGALAIQLEARIMCWNNYLSHFNCLSLKHSGIVFFFFFFYGLNCA